jgi:hypothetical protein
MLFAARIAAADRTFLQKRHVGGLCARLQLCQLLVRVGLDAEVVDPRRASSCGDGEIDARILEIHLA